MMALRRLLPRLRRDERGSLLIETAIVVPAIALLAIGSFEVSAMVARQNELQSAVDEAAAIALASSPDTTAEMATIEGILEASTGLTGTSVTVTRAFRCGTSNSYTTWISYCDEDQRSTFLRIYITDTYTPEWTQFGIGSAMTYRVQRMVQIS